MKFLCGSCRTKYQISDEKVRGKILTIRCKKCGAKILVRESLAKNAGGGTAVAPVAEEEPRAAEISAKKSVSVAAKAGGSAALASAFELAMGGGPAEADDMPTSIAPVPANLDNAGVEWYVAIDGEQFGPYAFAEIVRRIVSKEVVGRHYVWHDGMDNWLRVRDVKDLAPYLPQDKKKPPPPPPASVTSGEHHPLEDATVAERGAEIVDLSLKRAEKNRQKPKRIGRTEDDTKPGAPKQDTSTERAEQLDSVLNEALGIEGEGRTTQAEPERALGLTGTARTKEGQSEPSIDDLLAFEAKDDLFANVPRAADDDLVRESTRFYVAAAGVNARKSKNKVAMVLGGVLAMAFVGFLGAWAGGIIRIELPGIGNPFAGPSGRSLFASADEELQENENPEEIKGLLTPEQRRAAGKKRRTRSKGGGYINDAPGSESGGPRGDDAESVKLEIGGSIRGVGALPEAELPKSGIEDVGLDGAESLSQDVITKVVNARKRSVLICYQQSLKGQEDLRGKLEIRVTVEPSGKVKSATIETSAFKGSKLGRCIASKIQDWRFPSFSGGDQQILVPFVLEKGNEY